MAHHLSPARMGSDTVPTLHVWPLLALALFQPSLLCCHAAAAGVHAVLGDRDDAGLWSAQPVYGVEQYLRGAEGGRRGGA
jgi:hypothetical protein